MNRRQLVYALPVNRLTKVRVRRVERCRLSRDCDCLLRHTDVQRNVEVTRLVNLDLNFVLKRFLESGRLDNNLIDSGQKIKRIKQAVGIRGERRGRTPGDVRNLDRGASHSRAVRVHHSSGYLATQFLSLQR